MNVTDLRRLVQYTGPNATVVANGNVGRSKLAVTICAALLALQVAGTAIGRLVLPLAHPASHGSLASQLLSWDGAFYYSIAVSGYHWHPAVAAHHYQNVAFFPLQAIIDHLAILVAGTSAKALVLIFTLAAGCASIFAFDRLANTVLRPREAALATLCFGFWPASSFYLMGYPTGLISLFVIMAISDHITARFWRSGLWLGLGTATAPTVVFVGAVLGIHHAVRWLKDGVRPIGAIRLAGWALVALSGILAFMLYQWVALGNALAFVKAQIAWGTAPPPAARLQSLLHFGHYLQQPRAGLAEIRSAMVQLHHNVNGKHAFLFAMGLQRLVNFTAFVISVVALVCAAIRLRMRGRFTFVIWAGWAVFLGYLWFIVSTAQNMLDTPRLLLPAVATFLGLGVLLARTPKLASFAVILVFAAASVGEMAAVAAGYWVV